MISRADWLHVATGRLAAAGVVTPRRDAQLLLCEAARLNATELLVAPDVPIDEGMLPQLDGWLARRAAREPVSRILGQRAFMDVTLAIGPATLDPRPDTEVLVETALALIAGDNRQNEPLRILDIGTGSGAIIIALLRALPLATGRGIDSQPGALEVAATNAAACGVGDRLQLGRGNWLVGVEERFDLVVSNPPYIASADIDQLAPEVALYDPRVALDGGPDGLAAYTAIIADVHKVLRGDAWIVLEVGTGQAAAVKDHLAANVHLGPGHIPLTFQDLAGHDRCVAMRHQRVAQARKK